MIHMPVTPTLPRFTYSTPTTAQVVQAYYGLLLFGSMLVYMAGTIGLLLFEQEVFHPLSLEDAFGSVVISSLALALPFFAYSATRSIGLIPRLRFSDRTHTWLFVGWVVLSLAFVVCATYLTWWTMLHFGRHEP